MTRRGLLGSAALLACLGAGPAWAGTTQPVDLPTGFKLHSGGSTETVTYLGAGFSIDGSGNVTALGTTAPATTSALGLLYASQCGSNQVVNGLTNNTGSLSCVALAESMITGLVADLAGRAPIVAPSFTGGVSVAGGLSVTGGLNSDTLSAGSGSVTGVWQVGGLGLPGGVEFGALGPHCNSTGGTLDCPGAGAALPQSAPLLASNSAGVATTVSLDGVTECIGSGTLTFCSGAIPAALGYTPYNATNPAGYLTPTSDGSTLALSGSAFFSATTLAGAMDLMANEYLTVSTGFASLLPSANPTVTGGLILSYLPTGGYTPFLAATGSGAVEAGALNPPLTSGVSGGVPFIDITTSGPGTIAVSAANGNTYTANDLACWAHSGDLLDCGVGTAGFAQTTGANFSGLLGFTSTGSIQFPQAATDGTPAAKGYAQYVTGGNYWDFSYGGGSTTWDQFLRVSKAGPSFSATTAGALTLLAATGSVLGGSIAASCGAHQWFDALTASTGVYVCLQPSFSDISGSVAATQLPNPGTTTLGGVEAILAITHYVISSISTLGVPSLVQLAAGDISGLVGTYALLASPALTGTPTAPTAALSDGSTQIATDAFVRGQTFKLPHPTAWADLTEQASTAKCTFSTTSGVTVDFPLFVRDVSDTVAKLAIDAGAVNSGTVLDIGIRANASGQPGTLVADAGTITIAGTGAAVATLTTAQTLTTGIYWLEAKVDSAGATPSVVWGLSPGNGTNEFPSNASRLIGGSSVAPLASGPNNAYTSADTTTGSLLAAASTYSPLSSGTGAACVPFVSANVTASTQ